MFKIAPSLATFTIKYNAVKNKYKYGRDEEADSNEVDLWSDGAYSYSNIQLKLEHDWKISYLARTGSTKAYIEWYFDLSACLGPDVTRSVSKLELNFGYSLYESGEVKLQLYSLQDETADVANCLVLERNCGGRNVDLSYEAMSGGDSGDLYTVHFNHKNFKGLKLRAELSKGNGDNSWQHTQLFRQGLGDSNVYPFLLRFHFE
jgi:peptide-N4-(N-acetyl-beta-glucosaminyl)asparagine amidase